MANKRMKRIGTVVRDANDKTIVVAYTWSQRHRLYKRNRRRVTKFVAHDEYNQASIGDRVEIEECRPYSATKRWRLRRVIAQVDVVASTEAPEVISETDVPIEVATDDATESETVEEVAATEAEEEAEGEVAADDAAPQEDAEATVESESAPEATVEGEPVAEAQVDDAPVAVAAGQEEKSQ